MEEYEEKSDSKNSAGVTFVQFHFYVFCDSNLQI